MMVNASHTGVGRFRAYNFGFQGQEKDDEISGNGNSLGFVPTNRAFSFSSIVCPESKTSKRVVFL